MNPSHHAAISAVVSFGFWAWTRSFAGTLICFVSGILVDVDHHLDYWIARKVFPWRYQDLVDFCVHDDDARVFVVFHSYELIIMLWVAIGVFQLNVLWIGLLLGVTVHVIFDDIFNPLKPIAYFFIYRFKHRFKRKDLFIKEKWDAVH